MAYTFRLLLYFLLLLFVHTHGSAQKKPNIILVLMDDVGYGDLSCHGSPVIKTPNIDQLHRQSVRLTNYHSGTTCSPTRASLMTGRHYDKLGVWHTIIGRSLLKPGIITLPEILSKNGYSTAIFGKWHLGDNYPMRAQDRGFQYSLIHGGGGVGQTPDYWGNDYFDDTYFRNGKPEKFTGYCTDIWFKEALHFIQQKVTTKKPFFCYLALNAAHEPHRAPENHINKYRNDTAVIDPVYNAMVDNIDANMGKLLAKLNELKIAENTILIFTSDNGTSNRAGVTVDKNGFVTKGFNAGMRGVKGQVFEGGHRVPFFIRYPSALQGGNDVSHLTSCADVLPTLLSICGIKNSVVDLDGEDLLPYLKGKAANSSKTIIADTQRDRYLKKYKQFVVMRGQWRLVGDQLFNLDTDAGQHNNIAAQNGDIVIQLRKAYEHWWDIVEKENSKTEFVRIPILPNKKTALNCMDMFPDEDKQTAWNQEMVRKENNVSSGSWKLFNPQEAVYQIIIQQYPVEAKKDPLPVFAADGTSFLIVDGGKAIVKQNIREKQALFTVKIPKGPVDLGAGFRDSDGKTVAAQFAYIKKLR